MKTLLVGFAWLLIWTTPIQAAFAGWVLWDIVMSEHTAMSLTMHIFLIENLNFLHVWLYSWLWNDLLDFIYAFPAIVLVGIKLVVNMWLGWWLLPVARRMA